MPQRRLQHVLRDFHRTLRDSRDFAAEAYGWSLTGARPHISRSRRDSITELAFLRAFLGWEGFLEESFLLYMLGQTSPRGRVPHRFAFPPNRTHAEEWTIPEGRSYATWDAANVIERAQRFFRSGHPFTNTLRANRNMLDETRTIRNAIVHESRSADEKFRNLARTRLGTLPSNLTVGTFLCTAIPGASPPQSFLESYLERIELVAQQIIPGA